MSLFIDGEEHIRIDCDGDHFFVDYLRRTDSDETVELHITTGAEHDLVLTMPFDEIKHFAHALLMVVEERRIGKQIFGENG